MQVWNVLYAALWKYSTQKSRQNSPSGHHRTTLSGYIFATTARVDNRKKNLLSSNMSSTCPHNMAKFGPLAAEIDPVVWAPLQISTGFVAKTRNPSWQRYCTASSSGRQPNFAALNRGRYLCSAGRPSRLNSFLRRCDKRLYGKALCGYFDHVLGSWWCAAVVSYHIE